MHDSMDLSCREFVEVLASKEPAPGGGGAAAYVGAIGMALGNMVGSLTIGKKKYACVQDDIAVLIGKAERLQARLLELVAADAKAFVPLSKAYGMPAQTVEERAKKAEVMEKCLWDACEVPLDIMRCCCEAVDLVEQFADKGAAIAISDAGCAAACVKAALRAASLNVFINTKSMDDEMHADACNSEAKGMLDEYAPRAEKVFEEVLGRFI